MVVRMSLGYTRGFSPHCFRLRYSFPLILLMGRPSEFDCYPKNRSKHLYYFSNKRVLIKE